MTSETTTSPQFTRKVSAITQYKKLGWKVIPLKGKKAYWQGWDDPESWTSNNNNSPKYTNERTLKELERKPSLNIGIVCGIPSGIIALDVDQPKLLGYDPEIAIKHGALAHSTSKALRLIFRSSNPEVLNFSRKIVRKREEVDESLIVGDGDKSTITLIEVLGTGRQFAAPPTIHPETGEEYRWLTPLPDKPEDIMEIKDLNHLKSILFALFENKEIIFELFDENKKIERQNKETPADILEQWLNEIEKALSDRLAADRGDYAVYHCPFHPPDNHPSFAIYRNTFIGYDFHDGKLYTLKELAKALNIELPHAKSEEELEDLEAVWKTYELDKFGITLEELERLKEEAVKYDKNGEPAGVYHGVLANFLREKFTFVTNAITEEIWRYDEAEGVYKPDGEAFIKNVLERILNALDLSEFATIRRISEVVHHIKRYPQIYPQEFNRAWREGWINCKNGVFNIHTGEFRPHSSEFLFTWKINAAYDPKAEGENVERFLSTVVPADKRELLEEIIAYCLIPGQPYKAFFVLLGPTDSGKSTFIHLLEQFLGKDNVANLPLQEIEQGRFALAELVGKLANCFADLPAKKLTEAAKIKAITGGDTLTIEKKFQRPYFAKIDAKLIFSANRLPEVDESDAFWNRPIIIQFPYRFKKDEDFKKKLIEEKELSALLNIALKALERLKEKKFETEDASETVKLWKLASDPLSAFIDEKIEVIATEEDGEVPADIYEFKGDVFDAFKTFCQRNGVEIPEKLREFNWFTRAFSQKFSERGIKLIEGRKVRESDGKLLRVWYGIRLRRDDCSDERDGSDGGDSGNDGNEYEEVVLPDGTVIYLPKKLAELRRQKEEEAKKEKETEEENETAGFDLESALGVKRESIENLLDKDEKTEKSKEAVEYTTIQILKVPPIREFVGIDGQIYEIKEEGQILRIPVLNARPFLERGYAVELRGGDADV